MASSLHVLVGDRRRIAVRRAVASDRAAIVDLYQRLSPGARFQRFHHPTPRLNGHLRELLTDLERAEVWLAFDGESCVGESRIVPYPDRERADLAVTVVDGYQRNGLGRHLARVAVDEHAGNRQVIVFSIRADNTAALRLARSEGVDLAFEGGVLAGEISLPLLPTDEEVTTMSTDEPKLARLAAVELFRGCTHRQLREVARLTTDANVARGAVLCREGEAGQQCFVVVDGHAAVTIAGDEVATLGPGDIVGELALLDGAPRVATVTASTDLHVVVLSRSEFEELLARLPIVAHRILRELGTRLRVADTRLHNLRISA